MEVSIRPLQEQDAFTSYKWRNDGEVFKYTGNTYKKIITLESELEWIKRIRNKKDDYRCAIMVDGVYVGNIYLTDIHNKRAEYHIFIGNREYWGKGVAKEASKLIIQHGFHTLGLNEIYLFVNTLNQSAVRLYFSLGFKEVSMKGNEIKMVLIQQNNK